MKSGFSLIELLIAMAVAAILAAIAYPTYQHFVTKVHRTDGKVALLDLAQHMERYFQDNNHSFANATLEKLGVNSLTPGGYYNLAITNLSTTTYLLQANPIGEQLIQDKKCATLTLDQLGQKGATGYGSAGECW